MDLNIKEVDSDSKKKTFKEKIKDIKIRIDLFFKNPKKRLIFIIILGLILIALFAVGLYFLTHEDYQVIDGRNPLINSEEDTEVLYEAVLDGVMTDADSAKKHPLAIMIENHTQARPQAGLVKASIVYEAIAEGGITRFMGIFGTNEAEVVGPVRSARPYYVDWAEGYDAYYAHVGGNATALDQIYADGVLDLNQFSYTAPYWRDNNLNVSREHTMFTSTTKLRVQAQENGYSTANNFTKYKFKDDPKEGSDEAKFLPQAQKISVNISSYNYNVYFEYDPEKNSYKRFMANQAHTDRTSGDQLQPKNIVVMTVSRTPHTTRINENGWLMETVGSGDATIFLDGKEIKGSWKKSSRSDREIFYDQNGEEIIFNRGQLWITVIPPDSSYSATTTPAADLETDTYGEE